jgi:hypothetical protein
MKLVVWLLRSAVVVLPWVAEVLQLFVTLQLLGA